MQARRFLAAGLTGGLLFWPAVGEYVNFESSHVHPIDLTPAGGRLLAVNTPDARLEVFRVGAFGGLSPERSIPVGLEPVTVVARTDSEAWVVNHLSDTISIVDLDLGVTVRTLRVGDEPTDVVFARGRAFVAVSQEDRVKVFQLADLDAPPFPIDLFSSDTRALAVSPDGGKVYAVALHTGNQTTVVNANVILNNNSGLNLVRLQALGLNDTRCNTNAAWGGAPVPPYPPMPPGIERNRDLPDPNSSSDPNIPPPNPPVGLIVNWNQASGRWEDEAGQGWTHCLPFRLPDHDLFVIDANVPAAPPATVDHLGTTLFDVSVNPASGRVYVPNTEARNRVRFEHSLGVTGHMVDNRISVVDPNAGGSVAIVDLNSHIDRGSDPAFNLAERQASISQPGMMVWNNAGTTAYLTAIGSRKLFRLDGGCLSPACIFGPDRAAPEAAEVGEGPTGVALHEGHDRLYVLNRFSNSISVVGAATMTMLGEVPLHDPSSATVKNGRRLLYDGIDSSGHGDAACSSCHVSGNMDELARDLGNPPGEFVPYGTPGDNVRFIVPLNSQPTECPVPTQCSSHLGFDPQKGPTTTQTLRGMVEPLHWRGDRPTMNDFNPAFVGLMGARDVGPVNGKPAGHSAETMELFRQFALGIAFPPNPNRNVDDTLPNGIVTIPGHQQPGNPTAGQALFLTGSTDAGQPCSACHALPFGTAGGKLGGIQPGDPSTARAALFAGDPDGSPHSDIKVPHLRNMYEKFGPRFASHDPNSTDKPADQKTGFGFTHDGSIPDLGTFLSAGVFSLTPQQVRDINMFQLHFPTEIRPAAGKHLTVPPGPPGPPSSPPEVLLATLIALGNAADPNRHCDLIAATLETGPDLGLRTYALDGGIGSGGLWTTDVVGESQVPTFDPNNPQSLRLAAGGPITFLCGTIGSGPRLGLDRDLDGDLNGDDCSDGDPGFSAAPLEVSNVMAATGGPPLLSWDDQSATVGPGLFYEVASGALTALRSAGLSSSTACLAGGLTAAHFDDVRPDPLVGEGHYYVVRARTPECSGGFAPGQAGIETLDCYGG